jgi:hypothetical protein
VKSLRSWCLRHQDHHEDRTNNQHRLQCHSPGFSNCLNTNSGNYLFLASSHLSSCEFSNAKTQGAVVDAGALGVTGWTRSQSQHPVGGISGNFSIRTRATSPDNTVISIPQAGRLRLPTLLGRKILRLCSYLLRRSEAIANISMVLGHPLRCLEEINPEMNIQLNGVKRRGSQQF